MFRHRRLLQFRLIFATAVGTFFLAESLNPNFLRPKDPSDIAFVHVCIAIFGAAWLLQSFVLIRQLQAHNRN